MKAAPKASSIEPDTLATEALPVVGDLSASAGVVLEPVLASEGEAPPSVEPPGEVSAALFL